MQASPSPPSAPVKTVTRRCGALVCLAVSLAWIAPPASAGCVDDSCWDLTIPFFRVEDDGEIFIVPEPNAHLAGLSPTSGCEVKQINRVRHEMYALLLSPDDTRRDLKYSVVLLAAQSGERVTLTVKPSTDNPAAPGRCQLATIDLDYDPPPPPPPAP